MQSIHESLIKTIKYSSNKVPAIARQRAGKTVREGNIKPRNISTNISNLIKHTNLLPRQRAKKTVQRGKTVQEIKIVLTQASA